MQAAQKASPAQRRQESLQRNLARVRKSIKRLMTAYQEDLLSLDELRSRMPDLRQRERAMQAELQSIATQAQDRTPLLRLAETLSAFLLRLRSSAETLDLTERQRIVRLLVKEVLVGEDAIIIRHSIPVTSPPRNDESPKSGKSVISEGKGYLLRSGRDHPALRDATSTVGFQHDLQQVHHVRVIHTTYHLVQQPVVPDIVKVAAQVDVYDA